MSNSKDLLLSKWQDGLKLSGLEDPTMRQLMTADHVLQKSNMVTLTPMLPLLLSIRGDPYQITDHFPFEPFFRTRMAQRTLLKTGRQVSKSTSLAARGIVMANTIPYFSILYVAPLFEMIRRFSTNYVRPMIENSPVRDLFMGTSTMNSVLQRSFKNNSQMIFSFAYMDADRTRGISADQVNYDEVQDLDLDFIPIIRETMSASKYGWEAYAGTPKTMENSIQALWTDSSQAEWVIRCLHAGCRHWNVPAMGYDLDDMIGPFHEGICEAVPGVVCSQCRKPLNPRTGRWVHAFPERRWKFAGYHVPQIIMPMHYASASKWDTLLGKRAGKGNTQAHVFYNEVCGESSDSGAKLVTETDLRAAACLPWPNDADQASARIGEYSMRVLAVDWGGGGEDRVSFTSLAVLGISPRGVDVLWGMRSLTPHDHVKEAQLCLRAIGKFQCHFMAHDYTGAGTLRETLMVQAGFPLERMVPVWYNRSGAAGILTYKPATELNPRSYYMMDKSRSLLLTCAQIKLGKMRFFQYDYVNAEEPGLLHDFLALVEDKADSRSGRDLYAIIRDPHCSDDFAQAVNIGTISLFHATGQWPNLAETAKLSAGLHAMQAAHATRDDRWGDD